MIYKSFKDKSLSALGMGCMRLPTVGGDSSKIDEEAVLEMTRYALDHGVNYFDTAWGYHSGNSETVMGRVLKNFPRDSFYLASKFPGYNNANFGKAEEIFYAQLEKCQVEYFDFYLLHNVCESNIDLYLDPETYGDVPFILKMKEEGKIRHLGFSIHGSFETMKRLLDAYGEHLEFAQIQLNYIDWNFQNARAKVEYLEKLGIPVWVMEPVRGGKLATVDEKYQNVLRSYRPDDSDVSWAFRFIQSVPNIGVTLSGMSNMDQLQENIAIFNEDKPLSNEEMNALLGVASDMLEQKTLACTACRYCTDHCPMELDIPHLIELYNEHSFTGGGFIAPMGLRALPEDKHPSACIGCKNCEAVCPQNIAIADIMSDFVDKLKK